MARFGNSSGGINQLNPFERGMVSVGSVQNALVEGLKLRALQETMQDKEDLKNALQGADISSQSGMSAAIGKVTEVNPVLALKLRQELTKGSLEEQKIKTENLKNMVAFNEAAFKNIGGNFQGYINHYNTMSQKAPELAQTMPPPQDFIKDGQIDMNMFNGYLMRVANGTEVAKAALRPFTPPKLETYESGDNKITRQWNPNTNQYDIVATAPRKIPGEISSPFQLMMESAQKNDKAGYQLGYKLWQDMHGGKTPQVFKTKDNQFVWVTPGEPIPQGSSPASQDLFKMMMGGMIGNLLPPPPGESGGTTPPTTQTQPTQPANVPPVGKRQKMSSGEYLANYGPEGIWITDAQGNKIRKHGQ